jgi:hypothetical protein
MRKYYLRILIALIGVAGLGMTAKAQAVDQIVVNIPYGFTVAGQTLPAGTYRVNRVYSNDPGILILSSFENGAGAMILPTTQVERSSAGNIHVSFEQVGGQRFLSKIETANHVFTIPVSRSEILEAAAKSPSGTSASGSSAGSK